MAIAPLRFGLLASILSLIAAYIAEYGFGLKPCELCMMQRVPYALVIAVALLGTFKPIFEKKIIYIIALFFIIGSGVAFYHSAVEKHMIEGPTTCTSSPSKPNESMEDFAARIKNAPMVACDRPAWEWHGITMANLNVVWSLFLAMAVIYLGKHKV